MADTPIKDRPVPDLEREVKRLGLKVEGTGAGGNVTKPDLVAALEAHAASGGADPGDTSGRPDLAEVAEERQSSRIVRTIPARDAQEEE